MPNVSINFGGQTLFIPDAYFYGNVSQQFQPPLPTVPPLLFVGYFYGIKPQTPYTFLSAQDAINAARGGPGATYLTPMSLPSPSVNGANFITLIDASSNTQSSGVLYVSGSTTSGLINLVSTIWGPPANLIQASLSAGSTSGYLAEIYDGYTDTVYEGNNLGYPFLLAYTGSATGVTYSVSGPTGAVTGFAVTSPNAGESFTIQLSGSTYPTVQSVVEYLNGTGFYSATLLSSTQGRLNSQELDVQSGSLTSDSTASGFAYTGVTSQLYDPIYWFNTYSQVVSASLATANVSTGTLGYMPLTSLSGAQGVPPTLSTYSGALNVGLNTPAWAVFLDSNGLAEQTLLAQHCETASETQNSSWRRGFTGSSVGDSVTGTVAAAQALNARNVGYVYPGITVVNTQTGQNTTYGGLYAAAAAAGITCGNAVALPLTNKPLNGVNTESNLTQSQIYTLQNGGVMCLVQKNNVPTILSDVSTWQLDNNPENVFLQQVGNLYWVGYSLVNATRPYIGGIAAPSTLQSIKNQIKLTLNDLIYTDVGPGVGVNGVLASWNAASLTVLYNGATQQVEVSVSVQLVGQNRFITMTVYASPFSTTST